MPEDPRRRRGQAWWGGEGMVWPDGEPSNVGASEEPGGIEGTERRGHHGGSLGSDKEMF
jgi:hypothetical protein